MTTITKIPFAGVTREGVDKIQAAVAAGRNQVRSFIEGTVRRDSDELVDLFVPAMSAFEIEFERRREQWTTFKSNVLERAIVRSVVTFIYAMMVLILQSLIITSDDQPVVDGPLYAMIALSIIATAFLAFVAHASVKKYFSERKQGFVSNFEEEYLNQETLTAWGISKNGLYICSARADLTGVTEVLRVSFDDIQAFTFSEVDGQEYANLVTTAGRSIAIAMPEGSHVSGTRNVVKYLNKFVNTDIS
jgi:hypothetical protein